MKGLLPSASTVVDVGANCGFFTAEMAESSSVAQVLAVEPETTNYRRLQTTLRRRGLGDRVVAIQAAADAESGFVYLERNPLHHGDHKLAIADDGVQVESRTVDDLVAQHAKGEIGLIKIDVQGAELRVLAGAENTVSRTTPAIFLEVDEVGLGRYGTGLADLFAWVETHGYAAFVLDIAGSGEPRRRRVSTPAEVRRHIEATGEGYSDVLLLSQASESLLMAQGPRGSEAIAPGDYPSDALRLAEHRRIWERKPALRRIYRDFHRRLLEELPEGEVLEIGSGTGHLGESAGGGQSLTHLDLVPSPRIDVSADAHRLPFTAAAFDGLVMIDTLHHLQRPAVFLREAVRVLRAGGRLAMIEPGITPLSRLFYGAFHEEPVDLGADPWIEDPADPDWRAFDANQAVPTLLFHGAAARRELAKRMPGLSVRRYEWMSLFTYPLSGGFRPWSLLPERLMAPLLRFEEALMPWFGWLAAFRIFVVLERVDDGDPNARRG